MKLTPIGWLQTHGITSTPTITLFVLATTVLPAKLMIASRATKRNIATTVTSVRKPAKPKLVSPVKVFAGHKLYKAAFAAVYKDHIALVDPKKRAQWCAQWEHRYDHDSRLATESGTVLAINEMLSSLQQRFDFICDQDATKADQDEENGSGLYYGLLYEVSSQKGINSDTVRVDKNHPVVITGTVPGTSAQGKLCVGDQLLAINGHLLAGRLGFDVLSDLDHKLGLVAKFTVLRSGHVLVIPLQCKRVPVPIHVVHYKELNGVAYIKVDDFVAGNEIADLSIALKKAAKTQGLILDLRGNPGGNLDFVETSAEMLLPHGCFVATDTRVGNQLITQRWDLLENFTVTESFRDHHAVMDQQLRLQKPLIDSSLPLVVLVNGDSYSGAELLSGTLQANHRAIIIGEDTAGKGVGQQVTDLPDGMSIHVTNFRFRPGDSNVDWVGVIPDIDVADDPAGNRVLAAGLSQIQKMVQSQQRLNQRAMRIKQQRLQDFANGKYP